MALTVGVHMTGPHFVWGEQMAFYDPSVIFWPDHVINVLQSYGYTPQTLMVTLAACIAPGITASRFLHHDQYDFPWPDGLKRNKDRSQWGEAPGEESHDGARYWEFSVVPVPSPYLHPAPGQPGPLPIDLIWTGEGVQKAWAVQTIMVEGVFLGVVGGVLAYAVGGHIVALIPASVTFLPAGFEQQVMTQLQTAGILP